METNLLTTNVLTLISNFIYLICGIYLIVKRRIYEGLFALSMWLISHIYHTDTSNKFWGRFDEIVAKVGFIYVLFKYFDKMLVHNNMYYLIIVGLFYAVSLIFTYIEQHTIYNITHSLWHIFSAIFILSIITCKPIEQFTELINN